MGKVSEWHANATTPPSEQGEIPDEEYNTKATSAYFIGAGIAFVAGFIDTGIAVATGQPPRALAIFGMIGAVLVVILRNAIAKR